MGELMSPLDEKAARLDERVLELRGRLERADTASRDKLIKGWRGKLQSTGQEVPESTDDMIRMVAMIDTQPQNEHLGIQKQRPGANLESDTPEDQNTDEQLPKAA